MSFATLRRRWTQGPTFEGQVAVARDGVVEAALLLDA